MKGVEIDESDFLVGVGGDCDGAFASPSPHDGLPSYCIARHVLAWSAQDATVFCERGVVEGKSWLR